METYVKNEILESRGQLKYFDLADGQELIMHRSGTVIRSYLYNKDGIHTMYAKMTILGSTVRYRVNDNEEIVSSDMNTFTRDFEDVGMFLEQCSNGTLFNSNARRAISFDTIDAMDCSPSPTLIPMAVAMQPGWQTNGWLRAVKFSTVPWEQQIGSPMVIDLTSPTIDLTSPLSVNDNGGTAQNTCRFLTLETLGGDVIVKIAKYLPIRDAMHLSQASKFIRNQIEQPVFWRYRLKNDYNAVCLFNTQSHKLVAMLKDTYSMLLDFSD